MQLIQIGDKPEIATRTVREMFAELAQREADFIRTARERVSCRKLETSPPAINLEFAKSATQPFK